MKNISLFLNIYLCQLPICATAWAPFCDLLQYTQTHRKCNLFVLYDKNSNGLLKDLGGHEKRKTSTLMWSDVDHGQQPMKMHTEVTLLNKNTYTIHQLTLKNTELYQRVQLFSSLHSYLRQLKSFWFLSAVAWIFYCANKHLISLRVNACIAIKHRKRKPLHASYMMYFSQIFLD